MCLYFVACGADFTSEHGSFNSPAYPDSYPANVECVWTIRRSPGNRIQLAFRYIIWWIKKTLLRLLPNNLEFNHRFHHIYRLFNLESDTYCNSDYLEVRATDAAGPIIGRYCGNRLPSNVTVIGDVWIKFRSNDVGSAPGFMADYSTSRNK